MWKFEKSNLSEPAAPSADVQLVEFDHIPDLCKNIDNLQGLLYTMNPIPDDAKWILNSLLTQAKSGLISMTECIHRLKKETEESNQRSQPAQLELRSLKLELDNQKEQNAILRLTNSRLMACETQLKKDLMDVFQTKNQRIAELEKEIANQAKPNLKSKVVGYERNNPRPPMWTHELDKQDNNCLITKSFPERKPEADFPDFELEQTPPHPAETRKNNVRKPEPIRAAAAKHDVSPFTTRQPEHIPVEDFLVISEDVEQTEYSDKIILWNIPARNYGRVVGRRGQNADRLEYEYGVKISFIDRNQETSKLIITEGDADARRAASEDVINNLPVIVECPRIGNLNRRLAKDVSFQCDVRITHPGYESDIVTIYGRMDNCRLAYKKLKEDTKLWYP